MIYVALFVLGAAMGSFVSAMTWRFYKQSELAGKTKTKMGKHSVDLSMKTGRSVCVHCGHELGVSDLIPLISWLTLRGKCRYCKKSIEDSPLVELSLGVLFMLSYWQWPLPLEDALGWTILGGWLAILVGLMALAVYDLRHFLLPNRILFPLMAMAGVWRVLTFIANDTPFVDGVVDVLAGVAVGGGLFYVLFQVSQGRWIGGGDVKLGFLIGIMLGPLDALVALLVGFYSAALVVLPLMMTRRITRKSKVPFGPFLILGLVSAVLWAERIREAYENLFAI